MKDDILQKSKRAYHYYANLNASAWLGPERIAPSPVLSFQEMKKGRQEAPLQTILPDFRKAGYPPAAIC